MNIALIVPGFSAHADDWAIPALQVLATRLAVDHGVHVFSLRYPAAGHTHFHNLTLHATGGGRRFGLRSLPIWLRTVQAILRQHRQTPFDVLHAFWADEPGVTALWAGRLLRRPVIVSSAGGEFVYFPDIGYGTAGSPLRRRLVQMAVRGADVVTAGSQYQLELCQAAGAAAGQLQLAPLGLDVQHFRPGPAATDRPATLIQAASLMPVKNQALLLQVFAQVQAVLPGARLLLAGEGPLRGALQAQAEQLGVAGRVSWLREVPYQQMPEVYQQADLYIQTSRHESQGMAVLEAMACGVPVLGTPVGVVRELAARPATWDVHTLVEQVIALLGDTAGLSQARIQARALAERYDLPQTTGTFVKLYRSL